MMALQQMKPVDPTLLARVSKEKKCKGRADRERERQVADASSPATSQILKTEGGATP